MGRSEGLRWQEGGVVGMRRWTKSGNPRQFVDPSLMLLMTTAVVHKLLTIRLSEVNAPIRESLVIPFKFL